MYVRVFCSNVHCMCTVCTLHVYVHCMCAICTYAAAHVLVAVFRHLVCTCTFFYFFVPLFLQADSNNLVLQQTITLVERAISLAPSNSVYITEVLTRTYVVFHENSM